MSGNGIKDLENPATVRSSPEVVGMARRRSFSDAFKRRILDEADHARPGEMGLILRREGLYSSQLAKWRSGSKTLGTERNGMTSTHNRRQRPSDLRAENQRLLKENARLNLKLRKATAMLELQKKAAEILGYDNESDGSDS